MKFQQQFIANQTSEWKNKYVDYEYLQKLLKYAKAERSAGGANGVPEAVLQEIGLTEADVGDVYRDYERLLQLELDRVVEFYLIKLAQYEERYAVLEQQITRWRRERNRFKRTTKKKGVRGRLATLLGLGGDTEAEVARDRGMDVHGEIDGAESLVQVTENAAEYDSDEDDDASALPALLWDKRRSDKQRQLLKKSLAQLYRAVLMLRNFAFLNRTAIIKLYTRYDKVYADEELLSPMTDSMGAVLRASPLGEASDAVKLLRSAEALFSDCFNHGKNAKPLLRERKHDTDDIDLYMIGFFVGISLPLMLLWIVNVTVTLYDLPQSQFLALMPLFRLVWVPVVGLWMWGLDILVWHRARINHVFIFNFEPATALTYRRAFVFAGLLFALFWVFLYLGYNSLISTTTFHYIPPETGLWLFATILLVLVLFVILFPFDFFFRASRLCFFFTSLQVFISPFGSVGFREFFVGDVYTSLVKTMFDFEYTACYYVTGDFLSESSTKCQGVNSVMLPIISCLPLFWRFLQCLRRYYYTRRTEMLFNALKYTCGLLVVLFSSIHGNFQQYEPGYWPTSRILWICCFVISTLYMFCWDVFMDWGLGRVKSKNFFLRDELVWKDKKWFYFYCMASNFILRFFWTVTITPFALTVGMQTEMLNLVAATLEIIRRFTWAILRVENEHLNNVGQFRAVDFIPLPFDINMTQEPELVDVLKEDSINEEIEAADELVGEHHVLARVMKQRHVAQSDPSLAQGAEDRIMGYIPDGNASAVIFGAGSESVPGLHS